ncbi:Cof-type HAD-IIB family hydrolase [Lentibacillus salinarum]|uniref:Cof-type HAD-IIB family hydrolase n=1 Tax=Lentibacillus salinarum TaxID=446820 RepID=A0ABW3ZVX1_9BACI
MMKKLVFFDIDGTLLDDEKKLPESTKQAVADLQEAGHTVAIATGRAPFAFEPLLRELNINTYVSINGQYAEHNDEAIYKNPLRASVLEELELHAKLRNHPLMYVNEENWYSNTEEHPHISAAIDSLRVNQKVTYDPMFYQDGVVYQAFLFCEEYGETAYRQAFSDLEFIRWHDYAVDVMPAGGSKAAGIKKLTEHLQFSPYDVYAFGDGLNDIKMLQTVKNSIAMGNASDVVKEAASAVTKAVNEDGIWHGVRMAGLVSNGIPRTIRR